ncbi:peptidoglycan/LPS O-acetylase OafA/YrhL [Gracilibacillus halotolerans]|uniref:Peptidoglycan/LPS O-acetylase OafA/YrhL n=1 Tax=Gracilibacillus halotolerans TaxID=74386 RepID=A0A841RU66_9BACI|nr:acyltransferase family protein [Gracilibacillus halotolerans]MBB6514028.1 peptidoglycan/LPS O-acetylase OafA/YrhL [Gracilibacillus halotolerans]
MNDLRLAERRFRPELEGIRAVASLLVVVYHIWLNSVSGGVDVFFIVSGYLITTSLLNRIQRDGKINFFEYLLGILRRLLPHAYTVIIFIVIMSMIILPKTQWLQTVKHAFSSIFYFQNWQLANQSIDYLAQNSGASPFQHFWAMSLQFQFYILWPTVLFIVIIISKKLLNLPIRKTFLVTLLLLFVSSFVYSIYITAVNQPWAYFNTFARIWEFSLGAILALLLPYISLSRNIRIIIGWIGLGIIVLTGLVLPVSTMFPGYVALLPTFGVIMVILSAEKYESFGVANFLSSKTLMFIGSISYGIYLWHWPLLIFYLNYFQVDRVPFTHGLLIILITFILAWVSSKILENPIRKLSVKNNKVKLLITLSIFLIITLIPSYIWLDDTKKLQDNTAIDVEMKVEDYPGALTIFEGIEQSSDVEFIPEPINALNDTAHFYYEQECFTSIRDTEPKTCSYGNLDNPEYTIALVGGSHSGHWFTALEKIAENLNIRLDTYIRDGCRFSNSDFNGFLNEKCMEWNVEVKELLLEAKPDMIFTTATVFGNADIPREYKEIWEEFNGISEILAVRDNPRMPEDVPSCVEVKGIQDCSFPVEDVLDSVDDFEDTAEIPTNVTLADLSEYFCGDETCEPVIGNILVYRDEHHLTASYVKTLSKPLQEYVEKVIVKLENR